ncbi:hypothetical protein D3C77_515500 [compost metagenome]
MSIRIDHAQVVIERRTALRAAFRLIPAENIHDLFGRLQPFGFDFGDDFVASHRRTSADALLGRCLKPVSQHILQNLLYDRFAATA